VLDGDPAPLNGAQKPLPAAFRPRLLSPNG